jgi:chromosome segregation ATPase
MEVAETGRRINQLYNDVNAIYGLLDTIHKTQGTHGEEIESIKGSLTDIRATQMRHDNRLGELDLAIVGVSEQLKEMRVTQMRHENRFAEIAGRFDTHEAKLDAHDRKLDAQDRKLDLILEALNIGAN